MAKTSEQFQALLNRWKNSDDGSVPFEAVKLKTNITKSDGKTVNITAIKDYKKKAKSKGFKERKPTRGMSHKSKPVQLVNIIGDQDEHDLSIETYKPPVFDKTGKCKEVIRKAIELNFFFDDMTDSELSAFIDAFEPFELEKGSHVITQGELGDYFYVVSSGTVTFHVNGNAVGTVEAGASFGELALLYSCPRAATVIAESSPTKLYRVGQKTFRSLLQKQTKGKEAQKMKLLKSVDFLSEMSQFDLKRLGHAMTLNYFQEGDCLVKKGDEGDAFYIIHEGNVECRDISVGETKFENVTLKPGDYFGERSLATNEPRAATCVALTKGSAFRIDRDTFEKVLGKFSRVIMKSQDRRILEGIDILRGMEPKQLEELANLVVDKNYKPGDVILDKTKQTDAALYLVRQGTVQLSGSRDDVIKPGAYFGDDLLLLDTKQKSSPGKRAPTKTVPVVTAIAADKCLCGVLSLSDCRTIFDTTKLKGKHSLRTTIEELEIHEEDLKVVEVDEEATTLQRPSMTRETTTRWLKKTSKDGLRKAIRDNVSFDDLEKHTVLGEGQFGEVWLVSTFVEGGFSQQHFALKSQMIEDPTRGNSVDIIWREIDVLRLMDHPYIVGLIHHYEDPDRMHILMSLVHGGELFDVIHTQNEDGSWSSGLPEKDAAFYAMVIADTLDYIHRKQFIYRDLKPEKYVVF
jgi:CRP-like cAMP-binding protein